MIIGIFKKKLYYMYISFKKYCQKSVDQDIHILNVPIARVYVNCD
jgi:hypothetical protein